jgi:hypothetical protein
MRTFSRAALLAPLASGLVLTLGTPASADPVGTCPGGEPTCIYLPGASYPIGNPVGTPPIGPAPTVLTGPRVCDSTGTNCIETYVVVPGATVTSSTGTTFGTLNVPGLGVGVSSTGVVSIYQGTPTFTPGGTAFGLSASVSTDPIPVYVTALGARECTDAGPETTGPVTTSTRSCLTTVTLTI